MHPTRLTSPITSFIPHHVHHVCAVFARRLPTPVWLILKTQKLLSSIVSTQASSTQLSRKSSCFLILQHEVKDDGLKSIAKVLWTFVRFFNPVIALVDLATDATDGKSRRNSEMEAVPAFRLKYLKQSASVVSSEETYPYGLSLYTDSFPVWRQTRPKKVERQRALRHGKAWASKQVEFPVLHLISRIHEVIRIGPLMNEGGVTRRENLRLRPFHCADDLEQSALPFCHTQRETLIKLLTNCAVRWMYRSQHSKSIDWRRPMPKLTNWCKPFAEYIEFNASVDESMWHDSPSIRTKYFPRGFNAHEVCVIIQEIIGSRSKDLAKARTTLVDRILYFFLYPPDCRRHSSSLDKMYRWISQVIEILILGRMDSPRSTKYNLNAPPRYDTISSHVHDNATSAGPQLTLVVTTATTKTGMQSVSSILTSFTPDQ